MVQEGFDTALHASCLSDNLLYLAGPKLRQMCGDAVRDLGKIDPSLFVAYLGEEVVECAPSLPSIRAVLLHQCWDQALGCVCSPVFVFFELLLVWPSYLK